MSEQQQKLWTVEHASKLGHYVIRDADGEYVTHLSASSLFCTQEEHLALLARTEKNARSIVACVNACTGIDTESLEADGYGDNWAEIAQHRIALMEQRDELLAALRSAVETIEWMHGCSSPASDEVEEAIREGNAAIAKAEAVQA